MAEVRFFSVKTQFTLKNQKKIALWLRSISAMEKQKIEFIHYIFCSDNYLADLNRKYLNHTTLTDILSFDYSDSGRIKGEIYISIPRVKENAKIFNQGFETELRRVLSHGLLHFMGYGDKTKSQKARMRSKEEACLSLWK